MHAFLERSKNVANSNLVWAVLNQIILSLGAVAIIVILSNVLETETFGKTRFLAAVLAIFAFFSLPGIGPVVLQQMSIYSENGFRRALKVQLTWGLGASAGALIFAAIFYVQRDFDLALAFVISAALAPVANLYLMPGTALAGLRQLRKKTLYDGFIVVTVVLGAWYGAHATGTVAGTMLWYYGAQSAATIAAIYLVSQHLKFLPMSAYDEASDMRYGKQLTLFQLPFTLLPALEKVLIFVILGPSALALFVIAFLPVEHVRNAYRSTLQFLILPQLKSSRPNSLSRWLKVAGLLSGGGVVAIVLFTVWLLPLMFPEFEEVRLYMLLSTAIPLTLPAYVLVLKLLSERRVERLYSYAIITVLVDMLAFVVLTSTFGIPGAVAAKILTSFVAAGIAIALYRSRG